MNRIVTRIIPRFQYLCNIVTDFIASHEKHIVNIALFTWLVIVITCSLQHEMWRDEVRALSMALEGESFFDIFKTLRNEGHPFVWYWLLRFAHLIWPTPVVLQVVSILVGFASVTLFLKKCPLPLLVRILFIFGVLPLVLYSVSARNYGISMLLYFLFAFVYLKPQKNAYLSAVTLALLANTNYLAMMFAGILLGVWAIEEYLDARGFRSFLLRFSFPAILVLLGISLAFFTILMDANSSQAPPSFILSRDYLQPILDSALHPGLFFSELMAASPPLRDLIIFALLAGLLTRPLYAGSLYFAIFIYNLFSFTIIAPHARHQGVLFMLIVTFYWLAAARNQAAGKRDALFTIAVYLILAPLLYHQITLSKKSISEDVARELSSSAALGKFINTNEQLQNAVILGDPDYLLGPLTYYTRNRIYYVREHRYGTYERYVKVDKENTTLGDLLTTAEKIKDQEHVPVLFLLKHWEIPTEKTYSTTQIYGRNFSATRQEVLEFSAKTIKIAEFNNAVSDENYEVFLLPQTTKEEYFHHFGDYRQRMEQPAQ
jgi:hypothetical protein